MAIEDYCKSCSFEDTNIKKEHRFSGRMDHRRPTLTDDVTQTS